MIFSAVAKPEDTAADDGEIVMRGHSRINSFKPFNTFESFKPRLKIKGAASGANCFP